MTPLLLLTLLLQTTTPASRHPMPELHLSWKLVENHYGDVHFSESLLTVTNTGTDPLPATGWDIFFNCMRPLVPDAPKDPLTVRHINGDFFALSPGEGFTGLAPGAAATARLVTHYSIIKDSDAPTGFYLAGFGRPYTLPITYTPVTDAQARRGPNDHLPVPTPESRYRAAAAIKDLPVQDVSPIVPTPVSYQAGTGSFSWAEARITAPPELKGEVDYLRAYLKDHHKLRLRSAPDGNIHLALGSVPGAPGGEAYRLEVTPEGVTVTGSDAAGVFYGIQSLLALSAPDPRAVPAATVTDYPRFAYRGVLLDVARNFQTAEEVCRLLDLMAVYKLNRLHFHLTDDEGWRVKIVDLLELTDVGGRRTHNPSEHKGLNPAHGSGPLPNEQGSGFYTYGSFANILRYAAARHIEVVPEIDVPGHCRAAIKAMDARADTLRREGRVTEANEYQLSEPGDTSTYRSVQAFDDNVLNPCLESTYRFLDKVIDGMAALYKEANLPLRTLHLGGDEVPAGVWRGSPACAAAAAADPSLKDPQALSRLFWKRVFGMLEARGIRPAGWEEVALHDENGRRQPDPAMKDSHLTAYVWNNGVGSGREDLGYRLANAGTPVVLCGVSHLYFDLAYDKDPREPGLYWGGFVDTRRAWSLVPFDMMRNVTEDAYGNPVPPDAAKDRTALTAEGRTRILGIQGQLWGELLTSAERLDYQAFPKLLGLAERAWAPQPAWAATPDRKAAAAAEAEAWNQFAVALGRRELGRLDTLFGGVSWRVPPPGAVVEDGKLHVASPFPGLVVRYTTDGSEPTAQSPELTDDAAPRGEVRLRAFSPSGRGGRTVTVTVPET